MTTHVDLGALPPVISVPGLARWLADTPPQVDTDSLAAIARLNARIADLEQQLADARELRHELAAGCDLLEGP